MAVIWWPGDRMVGLANTVGDPCDDRVPESTVCPQTGSQGVILCFIEPVVFAARVMN